MDALFAPWRMQWVTRERPPETEGDDCVFCALPAAESDRENNIVARGERTYVLLNNMPYNPGHVMVLPYEHAGEIQTVDHETLVELVQTMQRVVAAIESALDPDGFNVGFNVGSAGGASITDHLHMHVIPRWSSDTSFLPLTANTAVVEEAVDETYVRLKAALLDIDDTSAGNGTEAVSIDCE